MDWDKLRIFHAAAEAGSFTHAGEALRMSQSAVSRQVSALEKELKVSLFHRHARGLVLTEQGEMLFGTASEIMSKLSTAETLLTDTTTKPSGDLRITAPIGLGTVWVTQRLREFLELYPDIRVELVLNDEQIAIAMRAADVAIWTSEPQQSDLIRRPLFTDEDARLRVGAVHPPPRRAADARPISTITPSSPTAARRRAHLSRHPLAGDGRPQRQGAAQAGVRRQQRHRHEVRDPRRHRHRPDPRLSDRGGDRPGAGAAGGGAADRLPIYFVYPEELKTAKKVQVFRDFLVAKARQWKF